MTDGPPQLKLRQYSFSSAEFHKLPEEEQWFFVRLALISDDLRHIHHLILHARVTMKSAATEIEKMLALHQLIFALRTYYGTLNEAWRVVHTGWFATKLSQKLGASLPDKAQQALEALKRYFDHDNLTEKIRHNFAFHFPDEPIKEALDYRPAENDEDGFVAGDNCANIFYMFAENVRIRAMLLKIGGVNLNDLEEVRSGVIKLYTDGLRVSDHFIAFANAVMVAIASGLNAKIDTFSSAAVTDFTTLTPVLFVDAHSILKIESPDKK
jgi:hypothetical protein